MNWTVPLPHRLALKRHPAGDGPTPGMHPLAAYFPAGDRGPRPDASGRNHQRTRGGPRNCSASSPSRRRDYRRCVRDYPGSERGFRPVRQGFSEPVAGRSRSGLHRDRGRRLSARLTSPSDGRMRQWPRRSMRDTDGSSDGRSPISHLTCRPLHLQSLSSLGPEDGRERPTPAGPPEFEKVSGVNPPIQSRMKVMGRIGWRSPILGGKLSPSATLLARRRFGEGTPSRPNTLNFVDTSRASK